MILTDEGILNALNENPFNCVSHISLTEGYKAEFRGLAKAQLKRDLAFIVDNGEDAFIRACHDVLGDIHIPKQSLLDEVKDV